MENFGILFIGRYIMKKIPTEQIKKIKTNIDIVRVISKDIELKKVGKNNFGRCPICDSSKSLSVSQEKQFAHCFSCGESFDVFGYFQKGKDFSFAEAFREVKCLINFDNEIAYKKLSRAIVCLTDIVQNDFIEFSINEQPVLIDSDIKAELKGFLKILEDLIADYYTLVLDKQIDEQVITDFSQIFYLYGNFIENKSDKLAETKYRNLFLFLFDICELIKENDHNLGGIVYINI